MRLTSHWIAMICCLACTTLAAAVPSPLPSPFAHPGILHTQADFDRIKRGLAAGAEPWKGGVVKLAADPYSQADWKTLGPFALVSRGPGPGENIHNTEFWQDGNAAYQNALMWAITGDHTHARKALEILRAWSPILTRIQGHDAILAASLYGDKFVNAAEILRYTDHEWMPQDTQQVGHMLRNVIYPTIQDFATFANGNWDTGCIKTMMGIGIFLDDRAIFQRAVDYYDHGSGNGSLRHYIIFDTGQCQESGRDQAHTQLGIGHLAEACEIGFHQGLDMYGADHNRLLTGFEYTAKYNLGYDVPFTPYTDPTGQDAASVISNKQRGTLRAIYEMVYNHYVVRKGLNAPFTTEAAATLRPEGAGFQADHPGFGTLLFSLKSLPHRKGQ